VELTRGNEAAATIEKNVRGHEVRVEMAREQAAAAKIEAGFRGQQARTDPNLNPNSKLNNQKQLHLSDHFSVKQRFAQAFCDSVPMVAVVLVLVTAHMTLVFSGEENPAFELFMTFFFIIEVSCRIWAHSPYYFFFGYERKCSDVGRWMNCADFFLSALDVSGMILAYFFAGNSSVSQSAKAGRVTRMVRLFKFIRTLRMWRVIKMFFLVFTRDRHSKVMERRKKLTLKINADDSWRIDRETANLSVMKGALVAGLDLSDHTKVLYARSACIPRAPTTRTRIFIPLLIQIVKHTFASHSSRGLG
jgi:hypothetical protein